MTCSASALMALHRSHDNLRDDLEKIRRDLAALMDEGTVTSRPWTDCKGHSNQNVIHRWRAYEMNAILFQAEKKNFRFLILFSYLYTIHVYITIYRRGCCDRARDSNPLVNRFLPIRFNSNQARVFFCGIRWESVRSRKTGSECGSILQEEGVTYPRI